MKERTQDLIAWLERMLRKWKKNGFILAVAFAILIMHMHSHSWKQNWSPAESVEPLVMPCPFQRRYSEPPWSGPVVANNGRDFRYIPWRNHWDSNHNHVPWYVPAGRNQKHRRFFKVNRFLAIDRPSARSPLQSCPFLIAGITGKKGRTILTDRERKTILNQWPTLRNSWVSKGIR